MKHFYITKSAEETQEIAKKLAVELISGDIVLLYGELGAGKTCFVKGMAQGLKIDPEKVTSPTFIILHEYMGKLSFYHFDFYRMKSMEEIENIGFFDYIEASGITVIEWPEKVVDYIKKERYEINFKIREDGKREITIEDWRF
ncbi:tRNA (adenosine(37)-N6)-threonylcarbamoyltransferase complex ATPase subunit type 1 TsaE [Candidatus Desantisbacteria bacterium]|nr:tRNA (adenosine(37)-N6)-threonylcarbamoyltransferase complex ATPase subunit type 1 TsaE [Candidatus Desantisbacteria bacterium]